MGFMRFDNGTKVFFFRGGQGRGPVKKLRREAQSSGLKFQEEVCSRNRKSTVFKDSVGDVSQRGRNKDRKCSTGDTTEQKYSKTVQSFSLLNFVLFLFES